MHDAVDDSELTKTNLQKKLASKIVGVFSPDSLGRLTNRQRGRSKAVVGITYDGKQHPLRFSFATNSKSEVKIDSLPESRVESTPVFLPSRELMSIFPGFVSLYDSRQIAFDETWRDTCNLLGRTPLRRTPGSDVDKALQPIMGILGGKWTSPPASSISIEVKARSRCRWWLKACASLPPFTVWYSLACC